jgi:hypothetical protein
MNIPTLNMPVSVFLILYGLFMLIFIIYSLFNVYHLVKYGYYSFTLYSVITVFTGGTIILIALSIFLLAKYNWNQPIGIQKAIDSYNEDLFPGL